MSMTHTETIGFCSQVAQFLEENSANLRDQGLDVTNWITDLTSKRNSAIARNAEQDDLKAQLKAKTAEAQGIIDDAYKTASTKLDAVIGVLGKTTPLAQQAAKLRSSVKKKTKKDSTNQEKPN
jgi:hypothetical protein